MHHENVHELKYVFEQNLEYLQTFDVGMGERIPSLQSVLNLIGNKLYINIEIKTPNDPYVNARYDIKKVAQSLYLHLKDNQLYPD